MSKMCEVKECGDCKHFDYDSPEYSEWCLLLNRKIQFEIGKWHAIPEDCPLPNWPERGLEDTQGLGSPTSPPNRVVV